MLKILFMAMAVLFATITANAADITLTEANSIVFNKPVSPDYVAKKTLELLTKSAKTRPLYLVLNTPGGSVSAGLQFVDSINSLKIPVHTITIFAASMGYQFVQELGKRYITPSGILMSHRGAVSGVSGQVPGELNSRVNFIQSMMDGMSSRASTRIGISKKDYDASIVNELWIYGQVAVNTGHADELANVSCSKELIEGTISERMNTLFGPVSLISSKCPLILEPIKVEFGRRTLKPEEEEKVKRMLSIRNRKVFVSF